MVLHTNADSHPSTLAPPMCLQLMIPCPSWQLLGKALAHLSWAIHEDMWAWQSLEVLWYCCSLLSHT